MDFLSHRPVTLSRHVQGCLGSAAIAATVVTSIYAALILIGADGLGAQGVAFELGRAWTSTAVFCLTLTAVIFSLMRSLLNGLRANWGILYVGAAVGMSSWLLRATDTYDSVGRDQFLIGATICIGLMIALGYWRVATRKDSIALNATLVESEAEGQQSLEKSEAVSAAQ